MDWIHCNNCASQPGNEEGKTFLTTNCGHIYCETCLLLPELKQCRVCQSSYNTMPLSSKMSKEVQLYFRNPIDDLQKLKRVFEFQHSHRIRLMEFNKEKIEKYGCLKKELNFLKEEFKRLEKENSVLLEENKRFKDALVVYKRKFDCLRDRQEFQVTPTHSSSRNGYDSFNSKTPKLMKSGIGNHSSESQGNAFRRPPEKQIFSVMSSGKSSERDFNMIRTPVPKMAGSFRSLRTLGSDLNSPASSRTSIREFLSQKDQYHRKVKLPGDRGGPSPSTSAFRRLALSKPSSLPNKNSQSSNKYSHYFNNQ